MNLKLALSLLCLTAASASAAAPYAEASVGYLLDSEKALVSARVGFEVANTSQISHQAEVEFAHTSDSEYGIDLRLVPILANYRFTAPMSATSEFFGGAGLGITRTRIEGFGVSASDDPFTWQVFTGISYKVTPRVALTGAVRYLRIETAEFFGIREQVGDDISLELGARFRF